jgi:hypothetical protein
VAISRKNLKISRKLDLPEELAPTKTLKELSSISKERKLLKFDTLIRLTNI